MTPAKAPRRKARDCPSLWVGYGETTGHSIEREFSKAHLRFKGREVYLVWREGKRVRSYYLGYRRKAQ